MNLTLDVARDMDLADSLPCQADRFLVPPASGGPIGDAAYLAGNSLGLQPRSAQAHIQRQLQAWGEVAVEGHFEQEVWSSFPERLKGGLATIVGALPKEVVTMNTLTVNLHLMLASFYIPTESRFRIVIEQGAFPSDKYAIVSHLRYRGFDPGETLVEVTPGTAPLDDVPSLEEVLSSDGDSIALVLLGAINYQTGELLQMESITSRCRSLGIVVGWDLAHAIGNVPMELHAWGIDFAVWCTYKYLNGGPGAIGGAFVHERHLERPDIPRLDGWWGNRLETRFHMRDAIDSPADASAWALSTPPTLAIAPIEASLEIFGQFERSTLRDKSIRLTGFLESCILESIKPDMGNVITPRDPDRRGAQLSIRVGGRNASDVVADMREGWGVMCDARGQSIIRIAPTPLYNSFEDCWRAAHALQQVLA